MKKKPTKASDVKSYDALICDLPVKRIQLEVKKWMAQAQFNMHDSCYGLSMDRVMDAAGERLVLELQAKIASRKFDYKKVSFPDGAWQACKYALKNGNLGGIKLVRWFIKKYPVRMVEVEMQASAYYPEIAIPDHAAFVEICMMERMKY